MVGWPRATLPRDVNPGAVSESPMTTDLATDPK
jgi:hypothetical protein